MKKLRFGIIGAGGIADRRTLPGMMLAKNVEVVAVMEINENDAERLRKKYSAKYAYTSAEQVVNNPEVDAVYIASPVVFHVAQAKLAAEKGKHILIEKPISLDIQEGEELLKYCAEKNVKIAAGFMMRFGAHILNMKSAIKEGKIGKVVSGYSQFTLWLPNSSNNWRLDKSKAGGGALTDMGVHCVDLLEYILDTRVKRVAAINSNTVFDYSVEDSSSVLLDMENGAQCVVQTNFNIPDEASKWRLEFFGTKGRLLGDTIIGQIDGGKLNALFLGENKDYDPEQTHSDEKGVYLDAEFGNMYTREVESFADSIINDKPLVVPASDALHIQKVIAAAYESSEKNIIVEIH